MFTKHASLLVHFTIWQLPNGISYLFLCILQLCLYRIFYVKITLKAIIGTVAMGEHQTIVIIFGRANQSWNVSSKAQMNDVLL